MQVYANSNRLSVKTILFFIVTLFLAFLPIATFLFFLKNDAFTGYFPPKFFMSESIHAGYLPLWNPYINFGIPQYGDMSSGYWSPITWIIASTVGYNAYSFTLEVLFYILAGGIGMYALTGYWQLDKRARIIAGIAFMCCGYTIGHLQHFNWLSGAAFLTWSFWSYLLLLKNVSLKNGIRAAVCFYLLVASAHPGIIISTAYFFIAVSIFHFFQNENTLTIGNRIKNIGLSHLLFIFIFLLLAVGMLTGYLDIIPYFSRGEKISLASSLSFPTTFQSWISCIFPLATVKNNAFFDTDVAMRNCYFSLTLFIFFLLALVKRKTSWQKFLLVIGLSFMLLSSGGFFKTFAYKFIPLIGYVRLNGEFRIFALLSFILIASIELDKLIKQKTTYDIITKWAFWSMKIIITACIAIAIYKAVTTKQSFLFNHDAVAVQGFASKLKALLDSISFLDTLWIQGIIQLVLLLIMNWCVKVKDWNLLKEIVIADMILASLLNIPFTGVGKTSVAHVQEVLNRSAKGIPIPILQPINKIDTLPTDEKLMIGDWSMYNKQIGVTSEVAYPIVLKNMDAYFETKLRDSSVSYDNQPYLFVADSSKASGTHKPIVTFFTPNKIELSIQSDTESVLIYQQNFYPHWYYQNGAEKKEVNKAGINFMSAALYKGENKITFSFEPVKIKRAMLVSAISFILCCLLLIFIPTKRPSPS